eukprot:m.28748 g.28748  ORF g.28748 m.28748 type:complete len:212 (-) comp9074_c0_seq2:334-969(-)
MKLSIVLLFAAIVAVAQARSCRNKKTCRNGGVCTPLDVPPKYKCECPAGYTGQRCESIITPQNWQRLGSCEYLAVVQPMLKYGDAESACSLHSAYLARVDSQEQQDFLGELQPDGRNYVGRWLGARGNKNFGNWVWNNGTDVPNSVLYNGWLPGEPAKSAEGNYCMIQDNEDGRPGWKPARCKDKRRYICQRCDGEAYTYTGKNRRRRRLN